MRYIEPINYNWFFKNNYNENYLNEDYTYSDFEAIDLPHTNKIIPYNYFDEKVFQFVSCYVKKLDINDKYKNKRIFVDFEGVMLTAKVFVNGDFICEHKGGYTFFEADITNFVKFDCENTLVVAVDSTERPDVPPFGNVVDYLTYGGIYREVSLRIVDDIYIKDVFLKCENCLDDLKTLECDVEIKSLKEFRKAQLTLQLYDNDVLIKENIVDINIQQGIKRYKINAGDLKDIVLWDIETPKLYKVEITLITDDIDCVSHNFGFRECVFKNDGFYLNNEKVKLIGLNRHQSYPYVGYAMPKSVQEKDADILKFDAGVNIVRTSHYPQSKHFLSRCDEIGLLVFEEIPGWQHIGDKEWQKLSIENVKEMITRDYNHPSIVVWGVRINESCDNHDFYIETNKIAHMLDDTRQTGGVRCIAGSELLEDVYTMNDFSHEGGSLVFKTREEITKSDKKTPVLITESNGHMYPTKRFDHEDRLVEHAKRHLRVINEANGRDDLCGGISWCAFDYNTHSCFGSGDKICYHGVFDMFRNPKYASFSYSSQKIIKNLLY